MPYYNQSTRGRLADIGLGIRVDRATATLPQTAEAAIFTISGGKVAIMGIIGEVTTIIETKSNNTQLKANPTTGTSVALCADLDITADEVGCLYGITGTVSDALVGAGAGYAPLPAQPLVVNEGTIDLCCDAGNSGSVAWSIWYVPLEEGAEVTAA
jgi:hypothetical protein